MPADTRARGALFGSSFCNSTCQGRQELFARRVFGCTRKQQQQQRRGSIAIDRYGSEDDGVGSSNSSGTSCRNEDSEANTQRRRWGIPQQQRRWQAAAPAWSNVPYLRATVNYYPASASYHFCFYSLPTIIGQRSHKTIGSYKLGIREPRLLSRRAT